MKRLTRKALAALIATGGASSKDRTEREEATLDPSTWAPGTLLYAWRDEKWAVVRFVSIARPLKGRKRVRCAVYSVDAGWHERNLFLSEIIKVVPKKWSKRCETSLVSSSTTSPAKSKPKLMQKLSPGAAAREQPQPNGGKPAEPAPKPVVKTVHCAVQKKRLFVQKKRLFVEKKRYAWSPADIK